MLRSGGVTRAVPNLWLGQGGDTAAAEVGDDAQKYACVNCVSILMLLHKKLYVHSMSLMIRKQKPYQMNS